MLPIRGYCFPSGSRQCRRDVACQVPRADTAATATLTLSNWDLQSIGLQYGYSEVWQPVCEANVVSQGWIKLFDELGQRNMWVIRLVAFRIAYRRRDNDLGLSNWMVLYRNIWRSVKPKPSITVLNENICDTTNSEPRGVVVSSMAMEGSIKKEESKLRELNADIGEAIRGIQGKKATVRWRIGKG